MPRGPRLDVPGVLHHVTVRGAGGRRIFLDAADREDLLRRLEALSCEGCWRIYAWALLPNHAHLLLRTVSLSLSRCMRRLLTGYAGAYNRRHKRRGPLFSSRYKSVVVEEEPYFLELVRYIHLNPLRLRLVRDLEGLRTYPYTGHRALCGAAPCPWQDTRGVLERLPGAEEEARRRYERFVAEGAGQGRRPELQGGGLVRSVGGWRALRALRQRGGPCAGDERVLGAVRFVEQLREARARHAQAEAARQCESLTLEGLAARVGGLFGIPPEAVLGPSRRRPVSQARQLLTYLWVERLGRRASQLAAALGRTRGNVSWSVRRGAAIARAREGEIHDWWGR